MCLTVFSLPGMASDDDFVLVGKPDADSIAVASTIFPDDDFVLVEPGFQPRDLLIFVGYYVAEYSKDAASVAMTYYLSPSFSAILTPALTQMLFPVCGSGAIVFAPYISQAISSKVGGKVIRLFFDSVQKKIIKIGGK